MSSLKVEIVKIENIEVHSNAEKLEVVTVFDWSCIVQKGYYKMGDLAIYT